MKTINLAIALILICAGLKTTAASSSFIADHTVTFEVTLDSTIKFTPFLLVYPTYFYENTNGIANPAVIRPAIKKGATWIFKLPAQIKPLDFSLCWYNGTRNIYAITKTQFEPSDHVKMFVRPVGSHGEFDIDCSGPGSAKYRCKDDLITAVRMEMEKMKADTANHDEKDEFKRNVRLINAQFFLVDKYQPEMSDYAYYLLKTEIICKQFSVIQADVRSKPFDFIKMNNWLSNVMHTIPDTVLRASSDYLAFKLLNDRAGFVDEKGKIDYTGYFTQIKNTQDNVLRDRLITLFFIKNWDYINTGYNGLLKQALAMVKDKECLNTIRMFENNAQGVLAYNFSLTSTNGTKVSFDQFKGKVVFIDFWFTGCIHCEHYFKKTVAGVEQKYQSNNNIVFITISIDKDKDQWLKSVAGGKYTSDHAINLYTNGEGDSNALIKYYNIMSYPRPMLIGRDGRIIKFTGDELRNAPVLLAEIEKALLF